MSRKKKKTIARIVMMLLDILNLVLIYWYSGYIDWPTYIPAVAIPLCILISIIRDRKKAQNKVSGDKYDQS